MDEFITPLSSYQHPAGLFRPDRNEALKSIKSDSAWAAARYNEIVAQLNDPHPITQYDDPAITEFRGRVGGDWPLAQRPAALVRLKHRLLADGWNAVEVTPSQQHGAVNVVLYSLNEPVVIVPDDGAAFPLPIATPAWASSGPQPEPFSLDAAIDAVLQRGAWRYAADIRDFIPAHSIRAFRQGTAPQR